MSKELINVDLNLDIIKKYICPTATESEAYMFLQLCRAQGLNPFLREAYLIKSGSAPATIVVGKETFTKRADKISSYDGFKAGIIIMSKDQKITYREGSFFVSGETLIGGWAEVYRKDRSVPFRNEAKFEEYVGRTHEGEVNKMWKKKPATMIRKVSLMQSLREAFPDEFGGLYSPEEISTVDPSSMPTYEMGQHPAIQIPEALVPPQPLKAIDPPTSKTIVTGLIDDIRRKSGKKKNGDGWTLYFITVNGVDYTTFSLLNAEEAKKAKEAGMQVEVSYTQKEKGKNLDSIKILDNTEAEVEKIPETPVILDPEGCTKDPKSCDGSSFGEKGEVFCGPENLECKFKHELLPW